MDGIPRRADTLQWTPVEKKIQAIVDEVEKMGADPLLTDAMMALCTAHNKISDFIEAQEKREKPKVEPIAGKWIYAPTSGIWHIVGVGAKRKEIKGGIQVLCGWVIQKNTEQVDEPGINGRRCLGCERFKEKEDGLR